MADVNILLENSDTPGARLAGALNTKLPVNITNTLTVTGNVVVTGTLSAGSETTTSQVITASSANAFTVGAAGTTNPALNIDTSGGVTDVTGLNINSNAAASGLALTVLSSGTNEGGTLDGKGSGTFGINTVSTTSGLVTLGNSTSLGGAAVNGPVTGTSASASALAVGLTGATNSAFKVDASTASQVAGLKITGAATGGTVAVVTTDSGAANNLTVNALGTGTIGIGTVSTGNISIGSPIVINGNSTFLTSTSNNALAVGRTAAGANAAFQVDASTSSSVTGISIKSAAAGAGVAITTTNGGGADENVTFAAKGAGTVTLNPAVVATAGGAANDGVKYGSIGVGLFTGTGAPSFSAMNGSVYTDSNATTTTTRIYVNKSGAGAAGTTWTALTTAA